MSIDTHKHHLGSLASFCTVTALLPVYIWIYWCRSYWFFNVCVCM